MKKIAILLLTIFLIPIVGFTQSMNDIDFISPINDGLIAVKKGNQWAFIDDKGAIIIDYRDDLVSTSSNGMNFPIFNDNKCIIKKNIDGIYQYGFIDRGGKIIIEPQFLKVTNFNNSKAVVLRFIKQKLGNNNLLNKPVFTYKYQESIINSKGEIVNSLTDLKSFTLSKDPKSVPDIKSKIISDFLVAIMDENNNWEIRKI